MGAETPKRERECLGPSWLCGGEGTQSSDRGVLHVAAGPTLLWECVVRLPAVPVQGQPQTEASRVCPSSLPTPSPSPGLSPSPDPCTSPVSQPKKRASFRRVVFGLLRITILSAALGYLPPPTSVESASLPGPPLLSGPPNNIVHSTRWRKRAFCSCLKYQAWPPGGALADAEQGEGAQSCLFWASVQEGGRRLGSRWDGEKGCDPNVCHTVPPQAGSLFPVVQLLWEPVLHPDFITMSALSLQISAPTPHHPQ